MAGSMAAPLARPRPATTANHVPLLPRRQVADLEDIEEGGGEPPAEDEEDSTYASSSEEEEEEEEEEEGAPAAQQQQQPEQLLVGRGEEDEVGMRSGPGAGALQLHWFPAAVLAPCSSSPDEGVFSHSPRRATAAQVACVCGAHGTELTGLISGSEASEGSEGSEASEASDGSEGSDASEANLNHYTRCSRAACKVWMHTAHTDAAGVAADADWVCPACVVKVRGDAGRVWSCMLAGLA